MVHAARGSPERPARPSGELIRRRLVCRGVVQGVGFRPAVHRLAASLGLCGSVRNDGHGATIEVQGGAARVACFQRRLPACLPPLARLATVAVDALAPRREREFRIEPSATGVRERALVPADAAPCAACRAELDDPRDRRHRHAFTTCSSCGPRFTLARSLPYDRERTSMAAFPVCPDCAREYADPSSRRFHTETICCPACGPSAELADPSGVPLGRGPDALHLARAALAAGALVAVKGVGGFQLACRADDPRAVRRLRHAKRRPSKPFALMAADLAAARALVRLRPQDEELLASARAPILLAPRRRGAPVARGVAPGLADLGVMLPASPLHVELFRDAPYAVLVMTSGNVSDEPICRTDDEARARLSGLCDRLLLHGREIVRRADDSVARTLPSGVALVRRSRGWVPEPVPLPVDAPRAVLALGGHLQVTACLATGAEAFPSQHVGDLETEAARAFLLEVARGLEDFLQQRARVVAVDLHPDYPGTWAGERLAAERGARLVRVQHHLAHAAAVLAEHGRFPEPGRRAVAVVLDGTGFGTDGTAWGCEWLSLAGDLSWSRLAHGDELSLVGGERAVREPWRVACAALAHEGAEELLALAPLARRIAPADLARVAALARRSTWPRATGAGRVFEAAGALLGLCARNEYEGEAAVRLEALASAAVDDGDAWPEVRLAGPHLPTARLLASAVRRLHAGQLRAEVAAGLHAAFCRLAGELTERVLPRGVRTVALAGGCLVNRLLARGLTHELERRGLDPLLPRALPAGDGGLSYGQAVVAAAALARATHPRQAGSAPCV